MSLELKDIEKLAVLSRLSFPAEKLTTFAGEFENILKFVDKIQQLNTQGVPPLTSAAMVETTPEREDKITAPNNRDALMANAPAKEMGFFVVPRIVE